MTDQELEDLYAGFNDDERFARESLTVLGKSGELLPMELGPAQQKLAALIRKLKSQRKPVRIIVLKARQVWISTYIAARFWRDTTHRPGQHTLVLAQDEVTAANVYAYYDRFDKYYQPFGGIIDKPTRTNDAADSLEYANESWVRFHTAKTTTVGRSHTLRRVHFSEYAFYGDNARALMAAVMAAMPSDPDTEAIIESTANGVGNDFHLTWQRAVAGESEWVPFFFAWHEHPEYVRAVEDSVAFHKTLSLEELKLKQDYNLSLEQLAWRRWKISTDFNGDEDLFKQEYPSNPEEAFLSSGRPRFDLKAVGRMPVVRDGLEGGLEFEHFSGRPRLSFLPRERGELVIYRRPEPNRQYIIGGDTAEGRDVNAIGGKSKGTVNPDYSVAQVLDRDTGEQVARLRARMLPAEFGRQLFMLGVYYNWAQLVIEANGPGLATIDGLRIELPTKVETYPRDLIYHRLQTPDQDPATRADLIGFKTTPVTRPQIISLLDDAIRTASVLVHDPVTLDELRTFVIKADGKAEHQYGCHDDTVLALAFALVGITQMPRKKVPSLQPDERKALNNYRDRNDHADERGRRLKLF